MDTKILSLRSYCCFSPLVVTKMLDYPHFSQALQHVSNARDAEALRFLIEVELLNEFRYAAEDNC